MRRGLAGTPIEHRRDAIKSLALAKELTRSAAGAYRDGHCARAIEQLDAAAVYLGAGTSSAAWTTDKPLRSRATNLGTAHEAVLKLVLANCVRPRIVR